MRKLLDGSQVPELHEPVTLTVRTKVPGKYKLHDLETGQMYVGQTDADLHWKLLKQMHDYRFIHIPKTGGISLRHWLSEQPHFNVKYGVDKEKTYLTADNVDQVFREMHVIGRKFKAEQSIKFSVVRHPYTRIFSAWKYMSTENINEKDRIPKHVSFEEFVKSIVTNPHETYRPQITWICGAKQTKIIINHVLYLETLEQDVKKLFGIECVLKKLNTTPASDKELVAALMKPEIKDILDRVYRNDFMTLGYKKNRKDMYDAPIIRREVWA